MPERRCAIRGLGLVLGSALAACAPLDERAPDVGSAAAGGASSETQLGNLTVSNGSAGSSGSAAAGTSGAGPAAGSGVAGGRPGSGNGGNMGSQPTGTGGTGGAGGAATDPEVTVPVPPANLATLLWAVGAEGTGAGFFSDARMVGVDGSGVIYVAEYAGPSRVQRFGSDGQFIDQWFTPGDAILTGLVVDRNGQLYLLQGGTITRYDGASGTPLGDVVLPVGSASAEAIALTPDNGLLAVSGDQILRFDAAGAVVLDVPGTVAPALDDSFFLSGVTMDGESNIYIFEGFAPGVYKFDATGAFRDRIGIEGEGTGLLEQAPSSVAVDGRGRIYASDWDGIEVLEATGTSRGLIESSNSVFGMVISDQDELIIIDRNEAKLIKYVLSP